MGSEMAETKTKSNWRITPLQTIALPKAKTPWIRDIIKKAFPFALNASRSSQFILLLLFAIELITSEKIVLLYETVAEVGKDLPQIEMPPGTNRFSDRYTSVSIPKAHVSQINGIIQRSFKGAEGFSDNAQTLLLLQFSAEAILKNDLKNIPIPDSAGIRVHFR